MIVLAKLLLGLALAVMFLHAIYSILRGRVYCKGVWFSRGESGWFWPLVAMYLVGSVVIGYLAFSASWGQGA